MNKKQRRYPYEALAGFLAKTQTEMAAETGVTRETIHRWKMTGVPEYAADALAIRLGLHPSVIWVDWFDVELVP